MQGKDNWLSRFTLNNTGSKLAFLLILPLKRFGIYIT